MDEQFTFSGSFYVIFQNLAFQILPVIRFHFTGREGDLHSDVSDRLGVILTFDCDRHLCA